MNRARWLLLLALACAATAQSESEPLDFGRDVLPLLADRCFSCHGPDAAARKARLRLDVRQDAVRSREGGAAVVPGDPDASQLLVRIGHANPEERMPPVRFGVALTPREQQLLRRWIVEGAEYQPHWAFVPPRRPDVPTVRDHDWPRDEVDAFVLARLEDEGIQPAAEAPAETWLRRVHIALTGLSPTASQVEGFRVAYANERIAARESVVDQLLASPHFGERMATQWLDLARYADTYGYQSDVARRVWPYRDWVIDAYNSNLPYSDFVRWQMAGDLLPEATRQQRIATAFHRLHRQTNEGGSVEEEFRVEYVSDRVQTFGTAFLGVTLECARCHDHKFDPISQREFYRLADYFDDIDECGLYSHFTSAVPTPAMDLPDAVEQAELSRLQTEVERLERELVAVSDPATTPHVVEQARFDFEEPVEGRFPSRVGGEAVASMEGPYDVVAGATGQAIRLRGDDAIRFSHCGQFDRAQPFSVMCRLFLDGPIDRAVLLHRTKSWTDAGSQGWQMLLDDGRLVVAIVHFWPGDALILRTTRPLATGRWLHVAMCYDGSSRIDGLAAYVDGERVECVVLADQLSRSITGGGPGDAGFGARFRDRSFVGGALDDVRFFAGALADGQVRAAAADRDVASAQPVEGEPARAIRSELLAKRRARNALLDRIPQLMVMAESRRPRSAQLLRRGHYAEPVATVGKGVPAALDAGDREQPQNRLELAEWLLGVDHPLTARVEVDRLWRALFGRGLVDTPEDFGTQGAAPEHRQLLDWLAVEFRDSGWNRKALLRRLALSSTFGQSSRAEPAVRRLDPDNRLFGRGPAQRLPAEVIRDNALQASGLLVRKIGGRSVMPYQPPGLWKEKSGKVYPQGKGDDLYRRSLYTYWKRTSPPPAMMILDAAKRDVCVARRQATVTPLQSLLLWNDTQFQEAARVTAARAMAEAADDLGVLSRLFLHLASRSPTDREQAALLTLLAQECEDLRLDPERAKDLLSVGEAPVAEGLLAVDHAAWTVVCSALMSADAVVMLR